MNDPHPESGDFQTPPKATSMSLEETALEEREARLDQLALWQAADDGMREPDELEAEATTIPTSKTEPSDSPIYRRNSAPTL